MTVSMYTVSIPVFVQHLNGLNTVLDKAASWVAARKMNETDLLNMRLSPDMFNLARQVRAATDHAANAAARLSGKEPLKFENDDQFPNCKIALPRPSITSRASSRRRSTAPRLKTLASPSQAGRHGNSLVKASCWATACPISISTPRRLTTFFVCAGWRSENVISWARRRHEKRSHLGKNNAGGVLEQSSCRHRWQSRDRPRNRG